MRGERRAARPATSRRTRRPGTARSEHARPRHVLPSQPQVSMRDARGSMCFVVLAKLSCKQFAKNRDWRRSWHSDSDPARLLAASKNVDEHLYVLATARCEHDPRHVQTWRDLLRDIVR